MPDLSISPLPITAPTTAATVRVWDVPVRVFHWVLVVTILLAFL